MRDVSAYVNGAYALAGLALFTLVVVVLAHLRHWAQRARQEDEK